MEYSLKKAIEEKQTLERQYRKATETLFDKHLSGFIQLLKELNSKKITPIIHFEKEIDNKCGTMVFNNIQGQVFSVYDNTMPKKVKDKAETVSEFYESFYKYLNHILFKYASEIDRKHNKKLDRRNVYLTVEFTNSVVVNKKLAEHEKIKIQKELDINQENKPKMLL